MIDLYYVVNKSEGVRQQFICLEITLAPTSSVGTVIQVQYFNIISPK